MTDIVDRLRGIYRIPITDGLGAVGVGKEPDNPNEFVRQFETPPIQKEAAAEIERLRAALERISKTYPADAHRLILSQREIINIARAALTAQPAAPGGDND